MNGEYQHLLCHSDNERSEEEESALLAARRTADSSSLRFSE